MKIIITRESFYDSEGGAFVEYEDTVRAEELTEDGQRRLLDLDNPVDLAAYEAVTLG